MARVPALALLALALVPGCGYRVYSPPARIAPMRSTAALPAGGGALRAQGGGGGALFGPDLAEGGLGYRHGLGEGLQVEAEGGVVSVLDEGAAAPHPNIYSGRVGASLAPESMLRFFSFSAGLGGGASAGGGFVAPDLGMTFAYENRYLVPFAGLDAFLSLPIDAEEVDISRADEPAGTHVDRPEVSYGFRGAFGLRLPLRFADRAASLLAAVTLSAVDDPSSVREVYSGAVGGLEIEL